MKILICGKGGSGKSTVAALVARDLAAKGHRVLAVDADESNYGLSIPLGLPAPKELMDQLGGKKGVGDKLSKKRSAGGRLNIFGAPWRIDDIPRECLSTDGNLHLLQIGKVKHFGEGCACPMGGLSREFLVNLRLKEDDAAIIDTEAGVEHLGRGVASGADLILVVVDPSYESIKLSEKISEMAKEDRKPVHFVLNRMDDATVKQMLKMLGKERVVGAIPFSESIQEKGLKGGALDQDVPGLAAITTFAQNATGGSR